MSVRHTASVGMERQTRRFLGGPGAVGYLVVAALVGVALLLYFGGAHNNPLNGGAIDKRGWGFVVGEVTGISAAVLLAVVVIMAARVAVLELLFGDLTKVYVAHGILGMTMFALVSFHPMMYLLGGLVLGSGFLDSAHVLVPFHVVVLDWISYIAIAIALIPTMYMRLRFENWRWIHLLLGVAMILTGYSILIDNSTFDTSQLPVLQAYLFVLFGLATISFLWVAVVRRMIEPNRPYRIVGHQYHPEANAMELLAEPVGRSVPYDAGQFAYVDLLDGASQIDRDFEAHPFSLASPPGHTPLSLVVESVGGYTERMKAIADGDEALALIHGAYGRLVIDRPREHKQLWLAGGIGITPFLAMAGELAENPDRYAGYDVTLVVGVDSREQCFKMDQLVQHAERFPGLHVHLWDRSEKGLPTAEEVAKLVDGDLSDRAILMSGPEPMIDDLTRQFLSMGVHRGQIRSERQIGPPGQWRVASPALRRARAVTTAFFGSFVVLVIACTVIRAIAA